MSMRDVETIHIPIQKSQGCLMAPIQVELTPSVLDTFRDDLLAEIEARSATRVILDVSGVDIIDRDDFVRLVDIVDMARLMGARTIVAGLRHGVVASLANLGAELERITAARDIDDALELLARPDMTLDSDEQESFL